MAGMTRRSLINSSIGLAAGATLARPYIANAQAKTATIWWIQGFAHEEDIAFKKVVDDYQKSSGNKIDYSIIPYAPMRQKIVSAITSGAVPDLFQNSPTGDQRTLRLGRQAGRCQRRDRNPEEELHRRGARLGIQLQQREEGARLLYGAVHDLGDCRTMSGSRWSRRPAIQWRISRRPGMLITISSRTCKRNSATRANAPGLRARLPGDDERQRSEQRSSIISCPLMAAAILSTRTENLNVDDPQVKEAIIKAMEFPARAYKEGFVPPSAINWNDADDNNAFHAKTIVMDLDGTISTEVAIYQEKGGVRRHHHDGVGAEQ